jgi:hypothetical protein
MNNFSAFGFIAGIAYYIIFQTAGMTLSFRLLPGEGRSQKIVAGSLFGNTLLQWIPAIFAFAFGFSIKAHLFALAVVFILILFLCLKYKKNNVCKNNIPDKASCILIAVTFSVFALLLFHSFRFENNEIISSQCTYGDMCMHLGFITSIADQQIFPPTYSILPYTKLSYPFLSDSISSSLYLFGMPLRFAYFLPMLTAGAQLMCGFLIFIRKVTNNLKIAVIAFIFFFFCGGFGIVYFLNNGIDGFLQMFSSFYKTPTNFVDQNIRWVNIIVDMLIPQRATLFGYALLVNILYFLYRAVFEKNRKYFIIAGLLGGALPMVHTHSFLALFLVSIIWAFYSLWKYAGFSSHSFAVIFTAIPLAFLVSMPFIQILLKNKNQLDAEWLKNIVITVGLAYLLLAAILVVKCFFRKNIFQISKGWGVFLVIILMLALPQLFMWTFSQAGRTGFIRGHFNWANIDDEYLLFYLKNLGITAVLAVPALIIAPDRLKIFCSPFVCIVFVCEFMIFQPNEYDNNKLLYIAYLFLCVIDASFVCTVIMRIRSSGIRKAALTVLFIASVISSALTIVREGISEYTLISNEQIMVADYVESNTKPTDVVLTNDRHNNAVAAIAGRNIVCGSTSYIYFHGLEYGTRYTDIELMYEKPEENANLFIKYGVDYILISDFETSSYTVDKKWFEDNCECVYRNGNVYLYRK